MNKNTRSISQNQGSGILYLVSTPIGNLADVSERAISILQVVDVLLAEDTRTAAFLLRHLNIQKKVLSYYSYNEAKRNPQILDELSRGNSVALISEAGTPLISDPGHKLVMEAIKQNITITPIPGPAAFLAALVASGLPTDRFVFEGFLPRKKGRQTKLRELANEPGTIILYESAVRTKKTIEDIVKIFGNRYIVIARELTKKFEQFIRGNAEEILEKISDRKLKGEVVLLIAGTKFKSFFN
jgi:16S rRNA (cytidine1402-2'-O)-methyltransferase